jgi:hypothetical protein
VAPNSSIAGPFTRDFAFAATRNGTLVAHALYRTSDEVLLRLFNITRFNWTAVNPTMPPGLPADGAVKFDYSFDSASDAAAFPARLAELFGVPLTALDIVFLQDDTDPTKAAFHFDGAARQRRAEDLLAIPDAVLFERCGVLGRQASALPDGGPRHHKQDDTKLKIVLIMVGCVVAVATCCIVVGLKRRKCGCFYDSHHDDDAATDASSVMGSLYEDDLAAYRRVQ